MFTGTTVAYDIASFRVRSAKQGQSCCGVRNQASITQNADGSLDIETEVCCGGDAQDVTRESRAHFAYRNADPVLVASLVLIPWLHVERHVQIMWSLRFFPIEERSLAVNDAPASTPPDRVPKTDLAIDVQDYGFQPNPTRIWYDPCTYVVDAFEGKNYIQIRDYQPPPNQLKFR